MSDAASGVAIVAIPAATLAAFGIDPYGMVAGLFGCIIAQSFMEREPRKFKAIAWLTLASILFASLSTLIVAPWVYDTFFSGGRTPEGAVRAAVAAFSGGFAQPIVVGLRKDVVPAILRWLSSKFGAKEGT